jgi:multidrug resistance efflux pump
LDKSESLQVVAALSERLENLERAFKELQAENRSYKIEVAAAVAKNAGETITTVLAEAESLFKKHMLSDDRLLNVMQTSMERAIANNDDLKEFLKHNLQN